MKINIILIHYTERTPPTLKKIVLFKENWEKDGFLYYSAISFSLSTEKSVNEAENNPNDVSKFQRIIEKVEKPNMQVFPE